MTARDTKTSAGGSGPSSKECVMGSDMNVNGRLLRNVKKYIMGNSSHVFFTMCQDVATLTEVFPCFSLSCKANARV
jgi:hypothetical protein